MNHPLWNTVAVLAALMAACQTPGPTSEGSASQAEPLTYQTPAEASVPPRASSGVSAAQVANVGSGTMPAQQPDTLSAPVPIATASTNSARLTFEPQTFDEGVGYALVRAHEAMLEQWRTGTPADASQTSSRALALLVATNVNAELEDCGCVSHPLGGLARRATFWTELQQTNAQTLHLDAGNALFNRIVNPADHPEHERAAGEITARGVLQSYAAMDVQAMAIGPQDLAFGAEFLNAAADESEVRLISANVTTADGLSEPWVILEVGALRVGVTSVMSESYVPAEFPLQAGVTLAAANDAAADAIRALRAAPVDLVVLIETAGSQATSDLLTYLSEAGALPDLMLVSGSGRTMHQAEWIHGVPWMEAASRGKHLLQLDLGLPASGAPIRFLGASERRERGAQHYSTVLTSLRSTMAMLQRARSSANGGPSAVEGYERNLNQQWIRLREVADAVLEPGQAELSNAGLVPRLHDVELTIVERTDIKAIVDAALESRTEVRRNRAN